MATTQFIESGTNATGGFEFWSSTAGTTTSDTTTKRNGNLRSIKLNTGSPAAVARATKTSILADTGRRISAWWNFPAVSPAGNNGFMTASNAAGTAVIQISLTTAGKLQINLAGAPNVQGTKVLETNTWYRISLSYTITSTTSYEIRVYINGTLEVTISSNGTLTTVTTANLVMAGAVAAGDNFIAYCSDIYVDNGTDLADTGNISVTSKRPAADNTIGFDAPIGTDPGANLRYTAVNERPISQATGRQQRKIAFVANGALASDAAITTLSVVAPALSVNDIMIASIYGNNNQVVSPPDGTWTSIKEINNGTGMRTSIFWKRAAASDSGATFNFTKPVDDNLLFAGVISTWAGCRISATPLDATAASSSANVLSDTVTYATFDPTETLAFVLACGQYNNDLTTAGAIAGTDPAYTNRTDLETATGADCSVFNYDGTSSGAATGSRSHVTISTADAVNTGVQFGLVPDAQENYTLQAAAVGDQDISAGTIVSRAAWVYAKATTGSLGTPKIMDNGSETSIVLTTAAALYTLITDSASYPSNAAGIGVRSSNNNDSVFLYECGTIIAYIPRVAAMPPFHRSQRFFRRAA